MNPYWGKDFFGFFAVLFRRLTGDLPFNGLASDEIQILVLFGIAIAAASIGTFLTLKKMTMLANSLSHTVLLGIVASHILTFSTASLLAVNLSTLLLASLITALLTCTLTHLLTHKMKLQEDASIGLVFTCLFALGIVLVTVFTRNAHIGIEVIMGNIDALHPDDLKLVASVAFVNVLALILFFKEFKITAFDGSLATSLGISTTFFNYLLLILTSWAAIASFRAVGVLLFLAFLVCPVLIARLFTHRLPVLIFLACAIGVVCSLFGVALSRHFLSVYQVPLSTGGLVVTLLSLTYALSLTFRSAKGLITQLVMSK